MEMVLDVYKQPYDPLYPVVCMDESPKQLIAETRTPIPARAGQLARYDYEYSRKGTSGNSSALLRHRPLRTQRATFTALGSSLD